MPRLSAEEQRIVQRTGEQLLAFSSRFTRGMFTNVYVWEPYADGVTYAALVGDPLKVALAFGYIQSLDEDFEHGMNGRWLDHAAKTVFGSKADIFAYERTVHLSEFLQRLASLLDDETHLTFIPDPGYPWPVEWYWDAKKRRVVEPDEPSWLIEVEDSSENGKMRPGVNPCVFFPARDIVRSPRSPVMGELRRMPVMVTHSLDLTARRGTNPEDLASGVRACGGLLFPSLAVGPVPASNFGYGCLVAHLDLVLDGLKPYREKRGERDVWVFPTDVWTGTTSTFMNSMAADLFDELHGHGDYTYGHGFAVLGVPKTEYGGPGGGAEALDSTGQLARILKRRMAPWLAVETPEGFEQLTEITSGTDEGYGYCEAKGRRVIALSEFPYFVTPTSLAELAERWAQGAGYRGQIVAVDWDVPDRLRADDGWNRWQWALRVAEVVRELRPIVEVR